MRSTTVILCFLFFGAAFAQPGWQGMDVVFAFYDEGVHRTPSDLAQDPTFQLVMDGTTVKVGSYGGPQFAYASFKDENSDPMNHLDTLWMQLGLRGGWMRIGFPPRGGDDAPWYGAKGLRIDFEPGRFLVTELHKELHVRGQVANRADLFARMPFHTLRIRCGDRWSTLEMDPTTGVIQGIAICRTTMTGRQEWADITLSLHDQQGTQRSDMHLRAHFWPKMDLGEFDLLPNHYYFDGRTITIDTAVPRDTVIEGGMEGVRLHIHPINPIATDTLRLEAEWSGSGAPVVARHHIEKRKDGNHITFSFGTRDDVVVVAESWTEGSTFLELPNLAPGAYILTQAPIGQRNARDVDLLLGREVSFEVRADLPP